MSRYAWVSIATGALLAATVFVGDVVYGLDPFLTVVAVLVVVFVGAAAGVQRAWAYAAAAVILTLAALVMLQFSLGGPAGDDVTELAERFSGGISWVLLALAVIGAVAGFVATYDLRRSSRA
jgi:hypothetical protein